MNESSVFKIAYEETLLSNEATVHGDQVTGFNSNMIIRREWCNMNDLSAKL